MLEGALGRLPSWKGARLAFDPVLKIRMVRARTSPVRVEARTLQSPHGLSLKRMEHLVRDRLSWSKRAAAALWCAA